MKSIEYSLSSTPEAIEAALKETDWYANEYGLDKKQRLHLRLLAEELIGLMNGVLDLSDGRFWLERNGGVCELHADAHAITLGENAKKRLLSVSSTGENYCYRGVTGKLCMAVDWLFSGGDEIGNPPVYIEGGFLSTPQFPEWSLARFRESMARDKKADSWDELEKSVLSKLSDDVRVSVRGTSVNIVITKRF
jgi:hypothetical protein